MSEPRGRRSIHAYLVSKRARQPEVREDALVPEPGDGGDVLAFEGQHGGWQRFGFKNQGQCIAFVNHGPQTRATGLSQ